MSKEFCIEYLKSSLSINNYVGCGLGCQYCSVQEFADNVAHRVFSAEELFNLVVDNPLFFKDKTPITINNRTDPMNERIKDDTFKLIDLFERNNYKNIIIIISKMLLTEKDLEKLESYNMQIVYIVSYANFSKDIERIGNDVRIATLETLRKREKVISLHYWRPIVKGLNDNENDVYEIFNNVIGACDASIISGIRLNNNIYKKLSEMGADFNSWNGDTKHKFLAQESYEKILRIHHKICPQYSIYRHTSCAISASLNKYDYNFHFNNNKGFCNNCPNQINCNNKKHELSKLELDDYSVDELLKKVLTQNKSVKWQKRENGVFVEDEITQEQLSTLTHYFGIKFYGKLIRNSVSEERFNG